MNGPLKWKLLAGFVLVFIAGGMTGALIGAAHARHLFFHTQPSALSDRMRRHLRLQLHLSKEQVAQISPIVDKAATQLGEIERATAERVRETISQEHRDIAPYLSEEQRATLRKLEQRHRPWQPFRGPRRSPAERGER